MKKNYEVESVDKPYIGKMQQSEIKIAVGEKFREMIVGVSDRLSHFLGTLPQDGFDTAKGIIVEALSQHLDNVYKEFSKHEN